MNPIDLEQLVDTELKRLPAPRAPRTLLPRVLAASEAQQRHAKPARGWALWPRVWQFVGGAVMAAVLVGIWKLAAFAQPFLDELLPAVGLGRATAFTRSANDAATVMRVLWDVVLQPVAKLVVSNSTLGTPLTMSVSALMRNE